MKNLVEASKLLQSFRGERFRDKAQQLEYDFTGAEAESAKTLLANQNIDEGLFKAALFIKHNSAQINEIVHTVGILAVLPKILEPGEQVESMSLAAGNTGRDFDLETNKRIAEFTFIEWQGGPEVIRQNKVFKDFYFLAEEDTDKRRELFSIGTKHVLQFMRSKRGIDSILNGNAKLGRAFRSKYGNRLTFVQDYYDTVKEKVAIRDICDHLPC